MPASTPTASAPISTLPGPSSAERVWRIPELRYLVMSLLTKPQLTRLLTIEKSFFQQAVPLIWKEFISELMVVQSVDTSVNSDRYQIYRDAVKSYTVWNWETERPLPDVADLLAMFPNLTNVTYPKFKIQLDPPGSLEAPRAVTVRPHSFTYECEDEAWEEVPITRSRHAYLQVIPREWRITEEYTVRISGGLTDAPLILRKPPATGSNRVHTSNCVNLQFWLSESTLGPIVDAFGKKEKNTMALDKVRSLEIEDCDGATANDLKRIAEFMPLLEVLEVDAADLTDYEPCSITQLAFDVDWSKFTRVRVAHLPPVSIPEDFNPPPPSSVSPAPLLDKVILHLVIPVSDADIEGLNPIWPRFALPDTTVIAHHLLAIARNPSIVQLRITVASEKIGAKSLGVGVNIQYSKLVKRAVDRIVGGRGGR